MGLFSTRIYGPFFLPGNITGELHVDMLEKCFIPQLTRNVLSNAIFQQDGAPAHYHRQVREFLDETFTDRWLGRCGPLIWAARSPDLTPLDFFAVYERKPTTIEDFINFITDEAQKITTDMC